MIRNGDLIPDKRGEIKNKQTRKALMRIGISQAVAVETTRANFKSKLCPTCPKRIDPFQMNTIPDGAKMVSPPGRAQEHFRSTGIRDGPVPHVGRWNFAEQMCLGDAPNWRLKNNMCIAKTWDTEVQKKGQVPSNDVETSKRPPNCRGPKTSGQANCPSQIYGGINFFFQEFATPTGVKGKIPKDEYTRLWLHGEYPSGFAARSPRTCVQGILHPHFGCQRCLGLIEEAKTRGPRRVAVERYCRCILSKDLPARGSAFPPAFRSLCEVEISASLQEPSEVLAEVPAEEPHRDPLPPHMDPLAPGTASAVTAAVEPFEVDPTPEPEFVISSLSASPAPSASAQDAAIVVITADAPFWASIPPLSIPETSGSYSKGLSFVFDPIHSDFEPVSASFDADADSSDDPDDGSSVDSDGDSSFDPDDL